MGRIWHTSDSHFDHEFVAKLRGFTKTEEGPDGEEIIRGDTKAHDRAIIDNWNSVVRPEDTVWHHGDVGMGRIERFANQLKELNGTKHLITGNHDKPFPGDENSWKHQRAWLEHFESVQAFARRKVGSYQFLLSHFPYEGDGERFDDRYTQYRLRDEGLWLVHGHIHQKTKVHEGMRQILLLPYDRDTCAWRGRQLHVGLDAWGLYPVSQDDVIAEMAKAELRR